MQSNQHICCIVSHDAELDSKFLFHFFLLYNVVSCVLLPPFPPHSLISLPTSLLSCRLRRCKTDRNASISTVQLLMSLLLLLSDTEQGRQIFLYGIVLCRRICLLTLCRRIRSPSIIFSRLNLWASWFPSLSSWVLQFTAEQRQGKRKHAQKEGSNVQLSFMVMTSISWVLFIHSLIAIVSMVS